MSRLPQIATDQTSPVIVLIDSAADLACARLHIADLAGFVAVLADVGRGRTVKAKDAAGAPL